MSKRHSKKNRLNLNSELKLKQGENWGKLKNERKTPRKNEGTEGKSFFFLIHKKKQKKMTAKSEKALSLKPNCFIAGFSSKCGMLGFKSVKSVEKNGGILLVHSGERALAGIVGLCHSSTHSYVKDNTL